MPPASASNPKQTNDYGKVCLLLWKNFLLQLRHPIHTFVDIFLPVLFFMLCAYVQKSAGTISDPQRIYPSLSIDSLKPLINMRRDVKVQLIFTPNNPIFTDLLDAASVELNLLPAIGVSNGQQLQNIMIDKNLLAGIEFHHLNDINELPKNLAYSLRFPARLRTAYPSSSWQTDSLFPSNRFEMKHPVREDAGPPSYYKEGFLAIQNAINKAFIAKKNATVAIPEIRMQRFPAPTYTRNLASIAPWLIPLFFLVGFNYTFMNTIRFMTIEKEKQLKEAMKIMGLTSWMHYLSWFIRTIIMLLISMVLITFLLTTPMFGATTAIFPNSSFSCLFILFIGYCLCLITFGFVICAFFTKSQIAMTASTFIWYFASLPFFITTQMLQYENVPGWLKVLLCFFPNTAISYSLHLTTRLEAMGVGLNWSTAFQTISAYDNLTAAMIFAICIVSSLLFFLIALYIENIRPGAFGVAKPWYFIISKAFWQDNRQYERFNDDYELNDSEHTIRSHSNLNQSYFESEPTNQPIGIKIQNLTKRFTSDKAAVNNLSLNIYDNQITSLLGQNGAGKTTVISMLTGMIEPSTGTAIVNGFDIRQNMDFARDSMGFCPQHNILFDELTVREHILFYCALKGMNNAAANDEANKFIRLLDLEEKANAKSSTLSGGMKRKLSVVIALCGRSKIVFLDEPTSGMDPGARRALWDILLTEKKDRTILLTTHFMDEADVLSDRIAILTDGELICSGSTFFLKKRFGTGYHLICAKGNRCESGQVTELLKKYMPTIQLENESDTELCYLLPEEENQHFIEIFEDLENNEGRLNINGFGVTLTTLEEIFLKLSKTEQRNFTALNDMNRTNDEESGITNNRRTLNDENHLLCGALLLLNQTIAMVRKRYRCWLRAWPLFVYYNIFVVLVVSSITFNIGALFSHSENLPSLEITNSLDKYKSPIIFLQNAPNSKFTTQYGMNIDKSSAELQKITSNDMNTTLLESAQTSLKEYLFQYLAAASVLNETTIVAWFNGQPLHSAPLSLDLVHNAIIKTMLGADHSICVANKPLSFFPNNNSHYGGDGYGQLFPIVVGSVMTVLSASYVGYHIKEKGCNARFLQYVSGVNLLIYWGTTILWDILTNCITIIIIIILLVFGQHNDWKSADEVAIVFLILLVYNIAMMPVICIWSLIFRKPSLGLNVVTISNISIMFAYQILKTAPFSKKILIDLMWVYPSCTVINCLSRLSDIRANIFVHVDIFSWNDGISKHLVVMLCVGIIAFIVLVVIEAGAIKMTKQLIFPYIKRRYPNDNSVTDDDVLAEKQRIDQMELNELKAEALVMKNVSKFYGSLCAVNKTSMVIKRGECFGLLGKNGAGKSSIFKMLTGETMISDGEIFTHGYNQKFQLHKIYKMIGYCPQFDALLTGLTCRESLEIFAMVRGISSKYVKSYAEYYAEHMEFIQHIDKKAVQLSGGNKRKLSTALALIGNPSVIFLDEPSTGMDPATKRNLWNFIIKLRNEGKSIVLTSHSIEECEALCTRITVLVNGQSKCLGSSQHLKNKFCKGFELKIKAKQDDEINSANLNGVKRFVVQTFNGAIFKEEYQNILTYTVPADTIKWSSVFDIMENAKKTSKIEDYSISQNSLEQVVLMFVKDQKEQKNTEKGQNTAISEEYMT